MTASRTLSLRGRRRDKYCGRCCKHSRADCIWKRLAFGFRTHVGLACGIFQFCDLLHYLISIVSITFGIRDYNRNAGYTILVLLICVPNKNLHQIPDLERFDRNIC